MCFWPGILWLHVSILCFVLLMVSCKHCWFHLLLLMLLFQSFWPSSFHPWSDGGLFIVIFRVAGLWIVTPLWPGWKIVVYPLSNILGTLMSDCCKCGRTSASHAFGVNHLNSNHVLFVVCIISPMGRWTVFCDCPSAGKSNSSLSKCNLSRTQKSSNQNLLYQEMSTRSGSNLVLRVLINFYSYTCNNIY